MGSKLVHLPGFGRVGRQCGVARDPLADVGLLLPTGIQLHWDPSSEHVTAGDHPIAANSGFLDADGLTKRYAAQSGVDPGELAFYRIPA